jgi:hypothetical protein
MLTMARAAAQSISSRSSRNWQSDFLVAVMRSACSFSLDSEVNNKKIIPFTSTQPNTLKIFTPAACQGNEEANLSLQFWDARDTHSVP